MAIPQPKDYPSHHLHDGVLETKLTSWIEFNDLVKKLLDHPNYVFRGHRRNDWDLEPTLTRTFRTKSPSRSTVTTHIENFRYAIRGRRGTNPPQLEEIELWALGQHHGLATPLLDWTGSPYVALFFAFSESAPGDETDSRVVLALNETMVKRKSEELLLADPQTDVVEFYRPLSDENAGLVNQNGLFTKSPETMSIEDWVISNFSGYGKTILAKIYVPNDQREECLKALNKMNINHATLFPDLYGASRYTNMKLQIENY